MTDDQIRAVMALADAYALTGYSAVSLTLAQAMPQRAALESALRAMPAAVELTRLHAELDRIRSDRDCEKRLRKDAEEAREVLTAELAALHDCCKQNEDSLLANEADIASARAAALEEAAVLCESAQDHREKDRALLAASKALNEGNKGDILSRLRHESLVGLMNGTCARNAAAIRAAITKGAKP